jgi:GrpB-like predicted nucleotidyltransferase (UPF0157 family)
VSGSEDRHGEPSFRGLPPLAIRLEPWRQAWAESAHREIDTIIAATRGRVIMVEHVGSTAVRGLVAKPVVDLLGGVDRLAAADASIEALASVGYAYAPEHEDAIPERRYFRKEVDGVRTHHLHVVVRGGDFWLRHLAFRDALRADPALCLAYGDLKRRLARECGDDRAAYTAGKTSFIERAIAEVGEPPR